MVFQYLFPTFLLNMSEGIKLKLKCEKCGYTWYYKGKRTFYAQCPNCYSRVKIKEVK